MFWTIETVSKGLERRLEEQEIGGQIETIQTKALMKWTKVLGKDRET